MVDQPLALQNLAFTLKIANLIEICFGILLYIVEWYILGNMEKKGLKDVGKYSELEKRFKLTTGLVTGTIVQILIWLGMAIALIFISENGTCTRGFALEWDKICIEC